MKNGMTRRFVMAAVLCVLIVALAAPALAASYSKVYGQTQDRIRVRASASSGATIIDNIVKGACVYVTSSKTSGGSTYVKVQYRNSDGDVDSGWVCQNDGDETFVKILSADQAKKSFSVTGGKLPSRKVGTFSASERKAAEDTPSSAGGDSETIKSVQKMLKALKYYSGEVTGNVGDKTKSAIKQFQREYDLTVDGVAGSNTITKLESVYKDRFGSAVSSSSSSGDGLRLGSSGSKVRDLQLDLTTLGYYWADITGSFGSKTEAAVKNFQEKNGLTADGVAGSKTINAIADAIARKGGSSNSSYASGTTLRLDSQGTAVADLQTDLKQLGYYYADITGKFGTKTEAAVKSFQEDKGLYADGVAGSKTLSAVAKAVAAAGGSVSDSSSGLKLGSTGDKVRDLQNDLTALGYYYGDVTGHYGSLTQTAVKKFQKSRGLVQDGIAGTTTINAIVSALNGNSSSSGGNAGTSLREGDSGSKVREMQEMLKELDYYYGSITGSFGSLTKKAVRAFQDAEGLTVDGIAGTRTLNRLYALTGKTNTSGGGSSGTTVNTEDSYGRVNKDNVNLRTSYSTSSAAKASLSKGKLLRITKVYNVAGVKWYYVTVKTGGVTHKGYLRSDMVTKISESEYNGGGGEDLDLGGKEILGMIRVTGSSVNLREEPDSDSKKVGTAKKGEAFYYVDSESGWFQTKAGYWIKKDYAEVMSEKEIEDYIESGTSDGSSYRRGDTGSMVLWIQEALDELDFYGGNKSGTYGKLTEEAVRQFQKAHGLSADGVAGPKTIAAIAEAIDDDNDSSGGNAKYNENIYSIDWFTYKSKILKKGETATVIDISKGRSFKIKVQSTGNHADVEPLTDDDTKVLCGLYNVANAEQLEELNKYERRAVVVQNAAGLQFVGSIYAVPHGTNTVSGNDFDGQFCIHFKGSTIHAGDGGSVSTSENHQAKIKTGEAALTKEGYTILTEMKQ